MYSLFAEQRSLFYALGLWAFATLLGFVVGKVALRRLALLAKGTRWSVDDAVVASLARPLPLAFIAAGGHAALRVYELSPRWENYADKLLIAILICALTFFLADLAVRLLELGTAALNKDAAPLTGVVLNVVRATVFIIGGLVLLSTLGVSVTPVLTTVGVGGLAVALGLQDTLRNIFAGVHLTLAGNVRVGDFVRLESGDEGYVDNIQWREARLRTPAGNSVVIPNSRLVESIVTNFYQPAKDIAVSVHLGVQYGSELERIERIILEVAAAVLRSAPGAVPSFEPVVRFQQLGEYSILLSVVLRANEVGEMGTVKHEFIKALVARFASEQLEFPIAPPGAIPKNAGPATARVGR